MSLLAPAGPVYQAGTLSGNPLAMAAGLATLELIQAPDFYSQLEASTERLIEGLEEAANAAGLPFSTTQVGGMFGLYFNGEYVDTYAKSVASDTQQFRRFFGGMLERGVFLAPSAFEAGFMSAAHSNQDIDETVAAASQVMAELAGG